MITGISYNISIAISIPFYMSILNNPVFIQGLGVFLYLFLINLTGVFLVWIDKKKAVSHEWRIPERVFFVFAFLGAGIGEFVSMLLVRHKTKHLSFVIGIPAISILFYGLLFFILLAGK